MGNYKKTDAVETPLVLKYAFDEGKHAHTFLGKPLIGTTTLIHKVLPPQLTWWASGMALTGMGWMNPKYNSKEDRIDTIEKWLLENEETLKDPIRYDEHLQICYRAHDEVKKTAGEGGTAIHNAIEIAIKEAIKNNLGYLYDDNYGDEAVERFATWGRGKQFLHSEVHVYSESLWLGGVVDIVYEDGGEIYLGDIKTSKAIYPSHFIQMGLYDLQQQENGFNNAEGFQVGAPVKVSGYTVINIPRVNAELNVKTYRDTDGITALGFALVGAYKTLQTLEEIC